MEIQLELFWWECLFSCKAPALAISLGKVICLAVVGLFFLLIIIFRKPRKRKISFFISEIKLHRKFSKERRKLWLCFCFLALVAGNKANSFSTVVSALLSARAVSKGNRQERRSQRKKFRQRSKQEKIVNLHNIFGVSPKSTLFCLLSWNWLRQGRGRRLHKLCYATFSSRKGLIHCEMLRGHLKLVEREKENFRVKWIWKIHCWKRHLAKGKRKRLKRRFFGEKNSFNGAFSAVTQWLFFCALVRFDPSIFSFSHFANESRNFPQKENWKKTSRAELN